MRTPLNDDGIAAGLSRLDGWTREDAHIVKLYRFRDYHDVIAFVNATAWVSHLHDHHPDLLVRYDTCRVSYTTHDAGGLTQKDFDCAAAIDALFRS